MYVGAPPPPPVWKKNERPRNIILSSEPTEKGYDTSSAGTGAVFRDASGGRSVGANAGAVRTSQLAVGSPGSGDWEGPWAVCGRLAGPDGGGTRPACPAGYARARAYTTPAAPRVSRGRARALARGLYPYTYRYTLPVRTFNTAIVTIVIIIILLRLRSQRRR